MKNKVTAYINECGAQNVEMRRRILRHLHIFYNKKDRQGVGGEGFTPLQSYRAWGNPYVTPHTPDGR